MEVIKKYWILILAGLIIRILVSAFTYHPDTKSQVIATATYLRGFLNPYEMADKLSPSATLDKLPMSYYIQFPFHLVSRPLTNNAIENIFFKNHAILFGSFEFWTYLIYAKFPLIIFDILLGIVLTLCITQYAKSVLTLWMFNPISIWATAGIGQIDIYSAFFVILSFYLLKKDKLNWAAFALGLGGAVKAAPLLLLPFLWGYTKNFSQKIILTILAFIPIVISIAPYLTSSKFRTDALFAPQLTKSLYAHIPLSGAESIYLAIFLVVLIYLLFFQKRRSIEEFVPFSAALFLSLLSLTHFHIQWFLWVMPLLAIILFLNQNGSQKNFPKDTPLALLRSSALPFLGLMTSLTVMLFLFESSLQVKLFAPLIPSLDQAYGLADILSNEQLFTLKSFAASLFAASSFYLSWKTLKQGMKI